MSGNQGTCQGTRVLVREPGYLSGNQGTCQGTRVLVREPGYLSGNQGTCQGIRVHVREPGYMSGNQGTCQGARVLVREPGYLSGNQGTCQGTRVLVREPGYLSGNQGTWPSSTATEDTHDRKLEVWTLEVTDHDGVTEVRVGSGYWGGYHGNRCQELRPHAWSVRLIVSPVLFKGESWPPSPWTSILPPVQRTRFEYGVMVEERRFITADITVQLHTIQV